ncbi:hypothetical protein [Allokutzneria sp. NRRL B-24872]|uniref:hypothetical protein n=1 Tax=Allokutzneria sp. NRRL B-24872 TaxID=1137961 RepID=UPI000A395186|nr:hypothetical protein [Allokutzneria sp. NRRL B-24872]
MRKFQRVFGLAVVTAAALAATAGTGNALPPKLSISVVGDSVQLNGGCANEAPAAHGWYGFVDGADPEEIKQMTFANGTWSTTFSGLKAGSYIGVMACDGEQETAVQHFSIETR